LPSTASRPTPAGSTSARPPTTCAPTSSSSATASSSPSARGWATAPGSPAPFSAAARASETAPSSPAAWSGRAPSSPPAYARRIRFSFRVIPSHQHRDVVDAAVLVRERDEVLARLFEVRRLAHHAQHVGLGHHPRETVGAQQIYIALAGVLVVD